MSDGVLPDGPIAPVPPLKSLNKQGEPYRRPPYIETQLGRILALPLIQRLKLVPKMYPECGIHLIRNAGEGAPELSRKLCSEACQWSNRVVYPAVRRLPVIEQQEIAADIRMRLLRLLLGETAGTTLDFYEISFAGATYAEAKNAIRSYMHLPKRVSYETAEVDADGDKLEDTLEALPDTGPGPEQIAVKQLTIEAAAAAVDRRQWRALKLHYLQGLPVNSSDRRTPNVARKMKTTRGEVRQLLESGIKAIRRRFGLEPEEGGAL